MLIICPEKQHVKGTNTVCHVIVFSVWFPLVRILKYYVIYQQHIRCIIRACYFTGY